MGITGNYFDQTLLGLHDLFSRSKIRDIVLTLLSEVTSFSGSVASLPIAAYSRSACDLVATIRIE